MGIIRSKYAKLRTRAGFTIMELLVVLAVLAIVLAITAPALAPIFRGTTINRLDNYAKEMYLAVQDQFIGMEVAGESPQFNKIITQAQSRNLGALNTMPHDATDDEWRNYYYLTSYETSGGAEADADVAMAEVMSHTSIVDGLTRGGRYVFEISPRQDGTDVYAVFYSEDPNFSYSDVLGLASRNRADRMNTGNGYPVGYYCASAASATEVPDHFTPRARFINGEELFLNITCAGGFALVGAERSMVLTINLSDGEHSQTLTYTGGTDFHLDENGNLNIDVLFDSMREDMHLVDIFPNFKPGADIKAQVELECMLDGTAISTPASARGQASANSLYAKNTAGTIEVANVRHVQNLQLLPANAEISAVAQTANIYFNAEAWGKGETTQLSRATRDYNVETYGTEYVNPLDPDVVPNAPGFTPLPTTGAAWSFDGRGNALYAFNIQGAGTGPVGLFATVQAGQDIRNTTLVDPVVSGSAPIGALAGEVAGTVDNCGVRLDVKTAADADKATSRVVLVREGSGAGGLVGTATGRASISNSYAAINVVAGSSNAVGGLVGQFASSGSIINCYASGELDANEVCGGLVGILVSGTVDNCYSTSNLYAAGSAGGLVGEAQAGRIANSASYGRVNSPSGGGFVGGISSTTTLDNKFLLQANYNDGLLAQPAGVEGADYASLASPVLSEDHSHPYNAALLGQAFPFTNVLSEHWGNWPAPTNLNPVMVYYELYGDGSYGYFGQGETPESIVDINTLDETLVVVEDGYALLSTYPIRGFDYNFNNGQDTGRLTLADAPAAGSYVELPTDGVEYWNGQEYRTLDEMHAYQLPFNLQMPGRIARAYYDSLVITVAGVGGTVAVDYLYYYNPDFAKMASSPNANNETAEPNTFPLLVRTARQLNCLGYQPAYWDAYIEQDRDIDFAYYGTNYVGTTLNLMNTTGPYANTPIGVSVAKPFKGTYDGRNYCIIDYCLATKDMPQVGLFGAVSGTVRNVHLATSQVDAATVVVQSSTGLPLSVGGLVGWLGGLVSGSSVSGYQLFCEGSASATDIALGGLVGVNEGSIDTSAASDVKLFMYSASASGANIGLGGIAGGTQGAILQCYAVENTFECRTSTSGSGRSISYGGIAGLAYAGNPAISSVYAYSFVNTTECAAGDAVDYFAIANAQAASLSNCYTLDVSSGAEVGSGVIEYTDTASLANAPLLGFAGSSTPRVTYGDTMSGHVIAQGNYPYPVVCQDAYGDWAHYGFSWR